MYSQAKEDTSLVTEFIKLITTLEQEFEGVEPAFVGEAFRGRGSHPFYSI